MEIAAKGYREVTAVFFPLYPFLLRACGDTEFTRALAGVIISNVSFLLALYFLYRLTRLDFPEDTAWSTVWIVAFFPTAAFFGAVYTESLFLLLLLLTFYAARRQNWAEFTGKGTSTSFVNLLSVVLVFYYTIRFRKQFRPSYLFLVATIILLHLCNPRIFKPYTISALRYLSVLFPFLQMLALSYQGIANSRLRRNLLTANYLLLNAVFSYWFGLKWFVG